jgi:hypothetical protein
MKTIKKNNDRWGINKISPYEIASIMDFINEYTIKYYLHYIKEKPEPLHMADLLYSKNKKLNNVKFELTMNLMQDKKLIDCIPYPEDESAVMELRHNEKGLEVYFNGGFKKVIKKSQRETWLMITGQISIIIAGLFYLFELLKDIICLLK